MDTKWKNRMRIFICAFLFTFGISGLLTLINVSDRYMNKDYFHTSEFQNELDQFTSYLNLFELNNIPKEEAKQTISVSENEITEYRDQLGNIAEQLTMIKDSYEAQIAEALGMDNQTAVEIYKAERDKKIEDISNIFKNDEYVRSKIVKEKEERIDNYYIQRENIRSNYMKYKDQFDYYFENKLSDKVVTSLQVSDMNSARAEMSANSIYSTSYSVPVNHSYHYWMEGQELITASMIPFEGNIAVADSPTNPLSIEYYNYKQTQVLLLIYILASIVALIVWGYLVKKAKVIPARNEKWRLYYSKLTIDAKAFFILLTGIIATGYLFFIQDQFYHISDNLYVFARNQLISMVIASGLWAVTFVQGQLIAAGMNNWQDIKKEWQRGLLSTMGKSLKQLFYRVIRSLKEAFLIRSSGTQLIIIVALVYSLGVAASMIIVDPVFLLVYVVLIAIVGIPLVILVIKSIGYFNRIVTKTNELAVGSLGVDLPVSGKSILAGLAGNINLLKDGVKTLQKENAKSERLKTELITNVSHDLRTPLTSIITYTELLKSEDLSNEDKNSYLEIIDRKSKRLKVLIDDLFEVSKMTSGNYELNMEKVDLVQLLQQALAEYDNRINESNLQFRITYPEMPLYALVDGKKLWRVFENLIGNVLKYSLENSRIYITLQSVDNQAIITFKNVSKYELSENVDELFERFKRGDQSRHTDGSGLGLAIAKSIIDLHEANLDIETDGDLFKVTISLKLVSE